MKLHKALIVALSLKVACAKVSWGLSKNMFGKWGMGSF